MPQLHVLPLHEHQLALAYPLVRSAVRVTAQRWETFARDLIGSGGGLLAVQADDSCLYGVAAFRQLGSLRHDRCLKVEILVAFELSTLSPVRKSLCDALEMLARENGCQNIVFTMAATGHADPDSASRASWEELGTEMETVEFVQHLDPPEADSYSRK